MQNLVADPPADAVMNDSLLEFPSAHHYKERKIVLTPIQQVDGTWVCHYTIIESGPHPESIQQNFLSRKAAAFAALHMAKSLIDLR